MATLTVPLDSITTDLRAGDRITAIDGRPLPAPRTVAGPAIGGAVPLVNALGGHTAWHLYPDTQVLEHITVDRNQPAPKPWRPRTSRRYGVTLTTREGYGGWFTTDGRYEVREECELLSECENPHPVRVGRELRERITAELRRGYYLALCARFGQGAVDAVRDGRAGYHCPGGQEHQDGRAWNIWDHQRRDYQEGTNCAAYATFADAASSLAGYDEERQS